MDYTRDAIFKAGKIHGCEDELYIIYLNEDSSVPTWEIAHVGRQRVLDYINAWEEDLDDDEFIDFVIDGAPHYWEEQDKTNPEDLTYFYKGADYIASNIRYDEIPFIINWAKEV